MGLGQKINSMLGKNSHRGEEAHDEAPTHDEQAAEQHKPKHAKEDSFDNIDWGSQDSDN
ncbi:hypothetical protein [Timonella sp. A28]|uniref:hypothetical protein n=1 Tax=Timonella sp. A28 TaxID=3442640 RepID=UPI003EBE672C